MSHRVDPAAIAAGMSRILMADETVSGEPVCEANSLLSGKKTGNFAKSLA
jgi:hypothetical protein